MNIEPWQIAALFLWSFSEAIFWPFMPDALLVPLVAFQPPTWWMLILVAVAGSASGGATSYLLARHFDAQHILTRMPFVRAPMIKQCHLWLSEEGVSGVRHQVLAMVPFKVFAFLSGQLKLPLPKFLGWAMLVRGARFFVVCVLAAFAGVVLKQPLAAYPVHFVVGWAAVFYVALILMVRRWEKAPEL